tara:strand:- start:44 stop:532 length:489 start_codon:yes stop_codon:yes gene_type:complete
MTEPTLTDYIVNNIIHEISTQIPYCDINTLCNYLDDISTRSRFYLVKEYQIYKLKTMIGNELNYKLSSNMFIIILPLESQVIVTSLDIIEKISGLSLWITNPQLREKILQFDIYNYNMSDETVKSPHIIVTDLPSHSLTLTKLIHDNTEAIVSLHELFMYAV